MNIFLFFLHALTTTAIYTLSLHDALPILPEKLANAWARVSPATYPFAGLRRRSNASRVGFAVTARFGANVDSRRGRSEEHTSELQSHSDLVCRLLLEKKKPNRLLGKHLHQ